MGKTSLLLGARFEYQGFEIVYRVENDTLIMAIYRRLATSEKSAVKGLKNSFELINYKTMRQRQQERSSKKD